MDNQKFFEVFTENCNNKFELYNEIKAFIEEEIKDAIGGANASFYDVLVRLSNSENNAGWEDRHEDRIDILNKEKSNIVDRYEDYLP